jgi:streptogramin lyase
MKFSMGLALAMVAYSSSVASLPARAQTTVTLGSGFFEPLGVALDSSRNVFVADTANHAVKEIVASGGYITVETLGSGFNRPSGVAVDKNGNVFVADYADDSVKEIVASSGYVTVKTLGSGFDGPAGVAVDAGGNVFVADFNNNAVKEILAATGYTAVNTLGSGFITPSAVAVDSSGNVFVADLGNNAVKEILVSTGYATVTPLGGAFKDPEGVALDGNNNVFVTNFGDNTVKEIMASSGYVTLSTLANGYFNGPGGVAVDPSGNVFVSDYNHNAVKEILAGPATLFASVLPGSRSVQVGQPATVFATMINAGPATQFNCTIQLSSSAPTGLTMSYQMTDPATNALVGIPNVPTEISGNNGSQSYLLTFEGSDPFSAPGLPLDFGCASGSNGVNAAPIVRGVDTVDLVMSSAPIADVIALAATPTNNGVIEVPKGGTAAFAVASVNIGAAAPITVSADTGAVGLAVLLTICQTDAGTGQCLAPPAPSVSLNFANGATPTFSVFVESDISIAFAPATSRIFVRFKDNGDGIHGSTSVAVETVP